MLMSTDSLEILGYIAGALTTTSLLPQFVKSLKTKSTKDLSYGMILILFVGVFFWAIYGIYIGSMPVIIFISNENSYLITSSAIMSLLICFKHRGNIQRLLKGKERKWRSSKDKKQPNNKQALG